MMYIAAFAWVLVWFLIGFFMVMTIQYHAEQQRNADIVVQHMIMKRNIERMRLGGDYLVVDLKSIGK